MLIPIRVESLRSDDGWGAEDIDATQCTGARSIAGKMVTFAAEGYPSVIAMK